ncbi:MAG: DUF5979 domain-containing protein [Coriobacteriia bacterium]|nr:DUF5979 domain-containing protein [Coriobacteriia bacterium]
MKRKFGVKLLLALVLAVALSMTVAVPAMADISVVPNTVRITKEITSEPGTTIPALTWTFDIEYVAGAIAGVTAPGNTTMTVANIAVPDYTVPVLAFSTAPVISHAPAPATGAGQVTFPHAGIFIFRVTERESVTPAIPSTADIDWSDATYYMHVGVINTASGGLEVNAIGIWSEAGTPGTPGGTKVDPGDGTDPDFAGGAFRFINHYTDTPEGNLTNYALAVTKTVTGQQGNNQQLFNYTMAITIPVGARPSATDTPPTVTFNPPAEITNSAGVPVGDAGRPPIPMTFGTNGELTVTFQLRHGEQLRIPTLPNGSTFTVTETELSVPNFTVHASAMRVIGGVTPGTAFPSGTPGYVVLNDADLVVPVEGSAISGAGRNGVDFTNEYQTVTVTGLFVGSVPFVVALALVTALLAMMVASRSRRRIEELPIAY